MVFFRSTISFYFPAYSFYSFFESLLWKHQLKILIYLLKKITVIYSGIVCNFALYFQVSCKCVTILS